MTYYDILDVTYHDNDLCDEAVALAKTDICLVRVGITLLL